jgi:glutamate-1-semialdehyde aminotransferase
MKLDQSKALLERAKKVIPSATQTFSKGPNQWARGVSPAFLERGEGAWVWDVDGNRFLDHLMALGPVILGYNDPVVNAAAIEQIGRGTVFSQMNRLEVEVAEILVDTIPCAEMVRFGKNGADATAGAVRIARAVTSRDLIACCGYHGWHDWYIGTTTRDLGVPAAVKALTKTFVYNDLGSLSRLFDAHPGQIAGVILEPVGVEPPRNGFLEDVRDLCLKHGSVLIFDEIVTGFRHALGGAQELFGVVPDLACFGKALANGFPLSAVVGRRSIMEAFDAAFFSGTFGGEAVSLAAAKATIGELKRRGAIAQIRSYGDRLLSGIRKAVAANGLQKEIVAVGYPARSLLTFPHADERQSRIRKTFFMQECVKRGLLYFAAHVPTAAHGDDELRFTLDTMDEVLGLFARAYQADDFESRLAGPPVEPVFRRA